MRETISWANDTYTQYGLISNGPIRMTSKISGIFKQWLNSEVFQVKQQKNIYRAESITWYEPHFGMGVVF